MLDGEGSSPDNCEDCGSPLPLEVCRSKAGYYIGTQCPQCGPYSRQSDYFGTREDATAELAEWLADLPRPAARSPGFHPDPNFTVIDITPPRGPSL